MSPARAPIRTNIHHTLKKKPRRSDDLADFVSCYKPENRHRREATWHPEKTRTAT